MSTIPVGEGSGPDFRLRTATQFRADVLAAIDAATPAAQRRPAREVALKIINETLGAAVQLENEGGIESLDDEDFRAVVVERVTRTLEADRRGEP